MWRECIGFLQIFYFYFLFFGICFMWSSAASSQSLLQGRRWMLFIYTEYIIYHYYIVVVLLVYYYEYCFSLLLLLLLLLASSLGGWGLVSFPPFEIILILINLTRGGSTFKCNHDFISAVPWSKMASGIPRYRWPKNSHFQVDVYLVSLIHFLFLSLLVWYAHQQFFIREGL